MIPAGRPRGRRGPAGRGARRRPRRRPRPVGQPEPGGARRRRGGGQAPRRASAATPTRPARPRRWPRPSASTPTGCCSPTGGRRPSPWSPPSWAAGSRSPTSPCTPAAAGRCGGRTRTTRPGRLAPADERADVWDEAFYPLATGRWTRGDGDAVVVGIADQAVRLPRPAGRLRARAGRRSRLRARQPTWSVNGLAVAALPDLLDTVRPAGLGRRRRRPADRPGRRAARRRPRRPSRPTPTSCSSARPACGPAWRRTASSSGTAPASACPTTSASPCPDAAGLARLEEALCAAG